MIAPKLLALLATLAIACGPGAVSDGDNMRPGQTTSPAPNGQMAATPDMGAGSDPDMYIEPGQDVGTRPGDDMNTDPAEDVGDPRQDMDEPGPDRTPRRTDWPKGLDWVRNNSMFVSGLVVQMDGVNANFVNTYYDDFGANAIHLWQTGLPNRLNDWLAVPRNDHRWLTWLDRNGTAGGQIAGGVAPNSPGHIGFQIGDEPRTAGEFAEMEVGINAIRAHDPDALVFINMSHNADTLDQMMSDQCNDSYDLISYDDYSMRQGSYEWLEYFRKWGLQCDKPYWRYMNSYGDDGRGFPSVSGMRWHALSGLVYGFTGHSWFLYQIVQANSLTTGLFATTGDINSARSPSFGVAATLNRELVNYGRVITRLESTDIRYVSSLGGFAQPTSTRTWAAGAGTDPYITAFDQRGAAFQDALIGFFEDNFGERYIMLQNPNHKGGSIPVSGDDEATYTLTFDFSRAPAGFDSSVVEHFSGTTGQVSDATLNGNHLVVTLPAGDAYLFKYATGAPWDMQ